MLHSISMARQGGAVGRVGVPHYDAVPEARETSSKTSRRRRPCSRTGLYRGAVARHPERRDRSRPRLRRVIGLEEVPDGYRAMSNRESIKVMIDPT